jgi:hypothetical protein
MYVCSQNPNPKFWGGPGNRSKMTVIPPQMEVHNDIVGQSPQRKQAGIESSDHLQI